MDKIFGVGLGKTGTTTLTWMLQQLGLNTAHYMLNPESYDNFDAVTDVPTYVYLLSIGARYPSARYVLTTRDVESWLASWKAWAGTHKVSGEMARARLVSLGCIEFDEGKLREMHARHLAFTRWYAETYAKDRFLELSLCDSTIKDEDKWDALCSFLGVKNPGIAIPRLNARR